MEKNRKKKEAEEEPKSFFERYEEFPDLKGKRPVSLTTAANSITSSISVPLPPPPIPTKLVGGDFNFLEDDDWLDGDSIDYSQNLFQDSEHFLPSLPPKKPTETEMIPPESHEVVKAKSLLAERCHSSKKKDIWKRTIPSTSTSISSNPTEELKVKTNLFKILKRPEPPIPIVESTDKLVKKFTTTLKLTTRTTEINEIETKKLDESKVETKETEVIKEGKKIVYSMASKTLQTK